MSRCRHVPDQVFSELPKSQTCVEASCTQVHRDRWGVARSVSAATQSIGERTWPVSRQSQKDPFNETLDTVVHGWSVQCLPILVKPCERHMSRYTTIMFSPRANVPMYWLDHSSPPDTIGYVQGGRRCGVSFSYVLLFNVSHYYC